MSEVGYKTYYFYFQNPASNILLPTSIKKEYIFYLDNAYNKKFVGIYVSSGTETYLFSGSLHLKISVTSIIAISP